MFLEPLSEEIVEWRYLYEARSYRYIYIPGRATR